MNGNLLLEFRNMRREEEEKILLLFFLKCWSEWKKKKNFHTIEKKRKGKERKEKFDKEI